MHDESLRLMDRMLDRPLVPPGATLLDVGSYDVNGSYRAIVERRGWSYTGLDVRPGPNVDMVSAEPDHFPFQDETFDVVICGNMLHNVARPWLLVREMARVLMIGGLIAIVAPAEYPGLSLYPKDYWRFRPDGLALLFDDAGGLGEYVIIFEGQDVAASAIKVTA
jgi:SAM-dependent methyltransferase